MNDLVKLLSERTHQVQVNRPDTSVESLLERIELKYLHVLFLDTETEIGIQLDENKCDFSGADLKKGTGRVHCEGVVTLNYHKVRCVVDFDLHNMLGEGRLVVGEAESDYNSVLKSKEKVLVGQYA